MEDWEMSIHDWAIRANQISRTRDVSEDECKMAVVLLDAVRRITNCYDNNISVENREGQYTITVGQKLNALEIKVQNPVEHYDDGLIHEATKIMLESGYSSWVPEYYVNIAYDTINDRADAGLEDDTLPLTAENIARFASFLRDSDSFADATWNMAANELDYFLEMERENEEE